MATGAPHFERRAPRFGAQGTGAAGPLGQATTGIATRILGCHSQTLYAMRKRGVIHCERTASGRLLWDVAKYLRQRDGQIEAGQ